jgi:hypothetical protein
MHPQDIVTKFERWMALKATLANDIAEELVLRKEIGAAYFPDAPDEGTSKRDLNAGYSLKYVKVFSWSPKLKLRGYRDCTEAERELIDGIVTTKPGAPTLELVPPTTEG